MHATQIDTMWFQAHPDREYRLRRQTAAEVALWPVQPGDDFEAWCIIRRRDEAMEVYATKVGAKNEDYDFELESFFDHLREAA